MQKIHIITGHRGTGKTRWLKIIQQLYKKKQQTVVCRDLDKTVESLSGKSVSALFKEGEEVFRSWEKKAFSWILKRLPKSENIFISTGAGFRFKKRPEFQVIQLRRDSDKAGRIFFDRPRLHPTQSPYKESLFYYRQRESRYKRQADEVFTRKEHFLEPHISDRLFLELESLRRPLFSLTLKPQLLPPDKRHWERFLNKRLKWGIRFFELNDESAPAYFVDQINEMLPKEKLLFASRKTKNHKNIKDKQHWCWDVNLGPPPKGVSILSLHERQNKPLKQIIREFSKHKGWHLKLSPQIYNFEELWEGFCWQREDSERRSFLPRSSQGRWKWYRLAFGLPSLLYFIKEGSGGVRDQPFFAEAVHFTGRAKKFAGVAGWPVDFSATPWEHNDFFLARRNMPVFSVPLQKREMTTTNLEILKAFGFVFFAVTSPLKKKAFECLKDSSSELTDLQSLNTLILHKGQWKGYNTDITGFSCLKKQVVGKRTVVWGGGGTRKPLQKILPKAGFYSARTRKLVFGSKQNQPEVLIWAVGRSSMRRGASVVGAVGSNKGCRFPPAYWKPSLVLDINYTEDSPGREYALAKKAVYKNGWDIFKKQAKKQRELFARLERL